MKRFALVALMTSAGWLGLHAPAQSAVVVFFDQGLTAAQQVATTSQGQTGVITNFTQADEFVIADPTLLTDVHFWTLEASTSAGVAPSAPSVIQYYVWSSAVNGVDADTNLLLSGSVGSGAYTRTLQQTGVNTSFSRYRYDFDLTAPFLLPSAGTYYLGLHFGATNTAGPTVPVQAWEYQSSAAGTDSYFRALCSTYTSNVCTNFGNWSEQGATEKVDDLAFQLTTRVATDVSAPGTLALLGAGLAILGLSRRRSPA